MALEIIKVSLKLVNVAFELIQVLVNFTSWIGSMIAIGHDLITGIIELSIGANSC